ncbi:hypothetical protein LWI28_003253 [Acer negundo]|uniref:LysM domain-containing protein n=1 Tax=Acer negundo TaxID=4023 RepID=A0AAD5ICS1_ACENE|nr:hypothetical protein LWI28_003253 [Acer negundo]
MESLYSYSQPMNCTDTTRLCTSFLAFKMEPNQTLSVIQSMFDVLPGDVTTEGNGNGYVFIRKNCSCLTTPKNYVSNTTFTVKSNGGYVYDLVMDAYEGLAILDNTTRESRVGAVISLRLFCGCSSGLWNYLMSYVMRDGDSVQSLASRFGISMDSFEQVNGIQNPDNVTFQYGNKICEDVELNKAQWSSLFEPYLFFESYKNYLQVDIIAEDADDLRAWRGWVESRLRQLTLMIERDTFGKLQCHPYPQDM